MRFLLACLFITLLAAPAISVELFRYRGAAPDGGTLEYVFESDEQNVPETATKEKVAEIAANLAALFYHLQIGAIEAEELKPVPMPYWLVTFSDSVKGPIRQMFFVVVLPDGRVGRTASRGADVKSFRILYQDADGLGGEVKWDGENAKVIASRQV